MKTEQPFILHVGDNKEIVDLVKISLLTWLLTNEASLYLRYKSNKTLEKLRVSKKGPRCSKPNGGVPRYKKTWLDDYMETPEYEESLKLDKGFTKEAPLTKLKKCRSTQDVLKKIENMKINT